MQETRFQGFWLRRCDLRRLPLIAREGRRHYEKYEAVIRPRQRDRNHAPYPLRLAVLAYEKYDARIFRSADFSRLWAAALLMPNTLAKVSRVHCRGLS